MAPMLPVDALTRTGDLARFCHRWKVRELSIFGSALGDDFGADSDVDVLVSFASGAEWSLLDLVGMRDELADLLGREVDLVEQEALKNPFRRAAILKSKRVLYAA
jgi:predicted nucleotidyltransferase